MTLLIVFVALALGVSFLCSVMEAVLLSVTPAFVKSQAGTPTGERLQRLKADIDEPLSAILTLNTIAHTVGATGAGAQALAVWGDQSVWIVSAVTVFSVVLTLAILFLSEIIPKTIGAVYWRGLAGPVSTMLDWTVKVLRFTGLIQLSNLLSKLISGGKKEGAVSREELVAMADLGVEEGVFGEQESQILTSLLRFNDLRTRDVMTPRTVLRAFPESATVAEVAEANVRFSRLPLHAGSLDQITGLVLKDDVLLAAAEGRTAEPLSTLRRDIMTVPDSLPLPQLFERFLERREHLALVVGEYGGTAGVATMEDVVETLLGLEIVDEYDHETDMQHAARREWERRASKLGILPPGAGQPGPANGDALPSPAEEQREAAKFGITGGEPGPATRAPDAQ